MTEIEGKKEIDIEFKLIDEFGNQFQARTCTDTYRDVGRLVEIGMFFNIFLKQAGYIRHNDFIFMEDITEDEYDYLADALKEYRKAEKPDDGV